MFCVMSEHVFYGYMFVSDNLNFKFCVLLTVQLGMTYMKKNCASSWLFTKVKFKVRPATGHEVPKRL